MGCIQYTANIPRIRLRVGEGRSHPERESPPPYPEMQLFSVDVDDAPAQGFLFPQPPFRWAWGRFLKRDAPSAGRSADPLRRVLLPGNLYRWRGASYDSSWSGGTSDSARP